MEIFVCKGVIGSICLQQNKTIIIANLSLIFYFACTCATRSYLVTRWAREAPKMPGIFVTFRHLGRAMFLGE